jgi:thioredoxin reductase (NADPH)
MSTGALPLASSPPLLDGDDPALFPKLTDRQLELLRPLGSTRRIEQGEVLFRDGDAAYDVMVLLEGQVIVVLADAHATRLLAVQRARDLMVEFNVFTGQRVGATGIVSEAGTALFIPPDSFRALVGRELEFGDFVFQMLARRRRAMERLTSGIRIVGSRFDHDTHRLLEFVARNRVLHNWLDVDDPRAEPSLRGLPKDALRSPIVFPGGGSYLVNPTNAQLAAAVGLRESELPAGKTFDLVVVGAGPGGLAASVYGASGGLSTATLDAVAVGGQAATSARIENYLGFPAGLSGADLAERARVQAAKFNAHIMVPRRAISLTEQDGFHAVAVDDGDTLLARSVILALGVQYRRLSIPRLADYEGLGVAYAPDTARQQLRSGDAAIVVGGANSAGQAALALSDEGRHVFLVVRADGLERGMASYLRERIARDARIEVLLAHEVRELAGDGHLERVTIENIHTGERRTLSAGAMIVLIGAMPRTDWLAGQIALDKEGYVLTGPTLGPNMREREPWNALGRDPFLLETSRPGVFAVGDVRSGSTKMVAPAVGEGGMAVRFAAEHLARLRRPGPPSA